MRIFITFVFLCHKIIVFPFVVEEELITSSVCKTLGWSILIQLFAKFIMGNILADTAILGNASKEEPLCSCNKHTSRARLQLDGMAAEKRRFCLSGDQNATILGEQSSALDWIHISHF